MKIVNFKNLSKRHLQQAAVILTESLPVGWPTLREASAEITALMQPAGNTLLAALEDEAVLGWGGVMAPAYDGNVAEIHPLAVQKNLRGRGIGSAIVTALEAAARTAGALTIWLGADDDGDETTFSGTDLYEGLSEKLRDFRPGTHQTAFYMKLGYKIIGVMPDANGMGRPDIYMAKRL